MSGVPGIAAASRLIARGELSPLELLDECLAAIEQHNDTLHGFVTVSRDRASREARAATEEIARRGPRSPLHGIPLAFKDIIDTAGILTTAGSRLYADHVPTADAACLARLAQAGVVCLGKTTTYEFASGGPCDDVRWPAATNPWNPERSTLGSSNGTAAAVAGGIVPGGLGTDTGGSIRAPAALTGIVGLRPTYGRVSRTGVFPLSFSMDTVGPMTRTVKDCALLLGGMSGHDASDPGSACEPVPDFCDGMDNGLRGLRIGVVRHFYEEDMQVPEAVHKSVRSGIEVFRALGAEVVDVTLPPLADWNAVAFIVVRAEAYALHEATLKSDLEKYSAKNQLGLSVGALISAADYLQAQRRRRELAAIMMGVLREVDVLLLPTWHDEAPRFEAMPRWGTLRSPTLTVPFGLAGVPALSIPAGFGTQGLPLGLQLVGRPFDEALLFRAGHAHEHETGWHLRHPPIFAGRA